MIFVTVGTHEQQFNRLIEYIDELKYSGEITEEVIIQIGYFTNEPHYCKWSKLLTYNEMVNYVSNARLVITHGGPSSIIMPLQIGKIPIVVPRQKQFNEHVNDHQIAFVKEVYNRNGNIIPVYDIEKLGEIIGHYEIIVSKMSKELISNNAMFNKELCKIVNGMF